MRALSSVKTYIDSDARFPEIRLGDLETAARKKPECSWSQTYLTRLRTYQPSQRFRAPLHRDAPLASPDVTPASRRLREAAAKAIAPSPVPPHSLHAVPLVPSALNAHCRTESVASARDRDVSRKLFLGGEESKTAKLSRKHRRATHLPNPPSLSSLACAPESARSLRHEAEGQRDEPPNR